MQTADAGQSNVTSSPNSFCLRSYSCGELTSDQVGEEVTLLGWLQFQRMDGRFITLRDAYGTTQVTVTPSKQVRATVVVIIYSKFDNKIPIKTPILPWCDMPFLTFLKTVIVRHRSVCTRNICDFQQISTISFSRKSTSPMHNFKYGQKQHSPCTQ